MKGHLWVRGYEDVGRISAQDVGQLLAMQATEPRLLRGSMEDIYHAIEWAGIHEQYMRKYEHVPACIKTPKPNPN